MKFRKFPIFVLCCALFLTACEKAPAPTPAPQVPTLSLPETVTEIVLDDSGITVAGAAVSTDATAAVYTANDIVYYEAGKDFTYGEGSAQDAHTPAEANAHTVVHITQPGAYSLSGKLSLGQIAVDLGDDAKKDPAAVVTLILNGVDITCEVAPAVIFYNVYECGSTDTETASKNADTSAAGANVLIADGTVNNVHGSYVARIYKPDSVVLNADKTAVEDASKMHKYDGAFYSKRSLNIYGGKENTGVLNIRAENEGLDSELHLTINGGNIQIESGNDGINTNEDGVSVTTINGGNLTIRVTGETGEGDGIDSNGWLVINGGTVTASACANSADAGIDSDMGIHINGGTVIAGGHMLDRIEDGGQTYAVFSFAQKQAGGEMLRLKAQNGSALLETRPENAYSVLIYSSPNLTAGTYTLWIEDRQLAGQTGGISGGPGMKPDGTNPGNKPDDMSGNIPGGMPPPQGQMPPNGGFPDGVTPPAGNPPTKPEAGRPGAPGSGGDPSQTPASEFIIRDGANMFGGIAPLSDSNSKTSIISYL